MGIRFDYLVQTICVRQFDIWSISKLPIVVESGPRPVSDVQNVVPKSRHTAIKPGIDAVYGCTHEGDGNNPYDYPQSRQYRPRPVRCDLSNGNSEGFYPLNQ